MRHSALQTGESR